MSRRLPWLMALGAAPFLLLGLWLWRDQGAMVWLSGLTSYCL